MKKAISKIVHMENNDMRAEYNFTGGVREDSPLAMIARAVSPMSMRRLPRRDHKRNVKIPKIKGDVPRIAKR